MRWAPTLRPPFGDCNTSSMQDMHGSVEGGQVPLDTGLPAWSVQAGIAGVAAATGPRVTNLQFTATIPANFVAKTGQFLVLSLPAERKSSKATRELSTGSRFTDSLSGSDGVPSPNDDPGRHGLDLDPGHADAAVVVSTGQTRCLNDEPHQLRRLLPVTRRHPPPHALPSPVPCHAGHALHVRILDDQTVHAWHPSPKAALRHW